MLVFASLEGVRGKDSVALRRKAQTDSRITIVPDLS